MAWIDLSLPILSELAPVPGHPPVTLTPIQVHEEQGRSDTYFCSSIHCGTPIDAPYPFDPSGAASDVRENRAYPLPGMAGAGLFQRPLLRGASARMVPWTA